MFKKCKANCQANDNLYLRGIAYEKTQNSGIFYYLKEIVNNKLFDLNSL